MTVEHGQTVTGWRAPDIVWFVCLVELLPDGTAPSDTPLTGSIDEQVTVHSADGLALRLARRPSGELVELYEQDWGSRPRSSTPPRIG